MLRSREVVKMLRTEDVRDAYVYNPEGNQWPGATVRREREFDEWLARVRQEAYDQGIDDYVEED